MRMCHKQKKTFGQPDPCINTIQPTIFTTQPTFGNENKIKLNQELPSLYFIKKKLKLQ